MKRKLFISYADGDMSKVNLIKRELKNNPHFEPLIIADRRHPLKLLTEKVSKGIEESDIVIPILTRKSIKEQWINQEIGYSMGINKDVIPIVEGSIMNRLKGFIHKQSDLSYNFRKHNNPGQENKNFKKIFLTLLGNLESIRRKEESLNIENKPSSPILSKLDEINAQKKFEDNRHKFLNSKEGSAAALKEVLSLFDELDQTAVEFRRRNTYVATEADPQTYQYIFKGPYHCFSFFYWRDQYNPNSEYRLIVKYWKNQIILSDEPIRYFNPKDEPKTLKTQEYWFDLLKDGSYAWEDRKNIKHQTTTELINQAIEWILEKLEESI